MQHRDARVSEEIKRVISQIIREDIRHPVTLFSIPHVRLTNDLSVATVYVSLFGPQPSQDFDHILQAKGFIRSQLAQKIRVRKVPALNFLRDAALADGDTIINKLGDLPQAE